MKFDLIGDVWDHLYRPAEIVSPTLLLDYALVYLSGGEVITLTHLGADEPLVMSQIKIGLCTILGDKYLSMLEWAHGAGIHIDVGIQLEHGDFNAAGFENCC